MVTDDELVGFDPLFVTSVPGGPLVGVKLMAGVDVTMHQTLLLAVPQ